MISNPIFSIVVPTYNRADMISKTIYSLLEQTYPHFEIIIVDDGSTDHTESVITSIKDERIRYYKKINEERSAARNFGAALAKGNYVNFFDSDDICLPNHLETAVRLIETYDHPSWFHQGYAWADANKTVFKKIDNFSGSTLNELIYKGNPLSCNAIFIRKDLLNENKFNEDRELSGSEDYEFWCRLAARYPLYYTNTITSLVIDHELRTVRIINCQKLRKRLKLLIHYLEQDPTTINYYGKKFNMIRMNANAYIAVHLASYPKYKLHSIGFLLKAILHSTNMLRNKTFYAAVKNLVLNW